MALWGHVGVWNSATPPSREKLGIFIGVGPELGYIVRLFCRIRIIASPVGRMLRPVGGNPWRRHWSHELFTKHLLRDTMLTRCWTIAKKWLEICHHWQHIHWTEGQPTETEGSDFYRFKFTLPILNQPGQSTLSVNSPLSNVYCLVKDVFILSACYICRRPWFSPPIAFKPDGSPAFYRVTLMYRSKTQILLNYVMMSIVMCYVQPLYTYSVTYSV